MKGKKMKLYDVPRNTWVRSIEPDCKDEFKFGNLDGMYSYCHDRQGNVRHYQAWMEVEIIENPNDSKH